MADVWVDSVDVWVGELLLDGDTPASASLVLTACSSASIIIIIIIIIIISHKIYNQNISVIHNVSKLKKL